jgi:UDP-N-acetylglucosamine 4,6-dehydratase
MILVTGGTGYLGSHLVKRLLEKYPDIKIRTISRSEYDIQKLKWQSNTNRVETMFGDVRDESKTEYALRDVDTVIHLAAMKHIDLCEENPLDAVTSNVYGTGNLLKYFNGNTFIGMSTDKALQPSGCYGATKLLQEKLILGQGKIHKDKRYMIVRSGNIFASQGSVVDRWLKQVKTNNELAITDSQMTRYFIDVDTLVDYMIDIMENGKNGCIYVPRQRCVVLADLVKAFIEIWGDKNTRIKILGLREGERMHEILYLPNESIITEMSSRSSKDEEKMSVEEIKKMLIKAKERL